MRRVFLALLMLHPFLAHAEDRQVATYGYGQIDYKQTEEPEQAEGFLLHRLNLIGDYTSGERLRFLADVEYEDGATHEDQAMQGSIKVSRAFLEYTIKNSLKINTFHKDSLIKNR